MSRDVSNFSTDVIERARSVPVLVDFWAPWCAPCRVLKPVLEKLASEARWRWTLVIVHVDSHPELAEQFGIRGIPNLKLFHQGGHLRRVQRCPSGRHRERLARSKLAHAVTAPSRRQFRSAFSTQSSS